jgi:membrane protein DedA with SNARE-associated domain
MTWAVTHLGPLGVLLLMIPESACLPVPSEVTLMAAGLAVHQGAFGLPLAIAAATLGNLLGSLLAYAAGRRGALDLFGRAISSRCDRLFSRHGDRAVFIARLLPLARSFISLPAGRARVPLPRFIAMTVAGCALWSLAFVLAGDLAGNAWRSLSGTVGHVMLLAGALLAVLFVARRPASPQSRSACRSTG